MVNDSQTTKKVIKGGAFDQLVRKTISPAREGLEQGECKSNYATQPNVGFRPAMEFTVEDEVSGFLAGQTPVDLFFLYDASASQDGQITKMLEASKKIVKMFAGT